ncbi:MAG: type II secretion system major pseudopilin GspG [Rhodocyclaceae bacterium]|jgi:general secretion pathway protein G|nr:type II secretion system major pseudopilin GspG [Rhodocyclaceae bacterium]
MLYRPDISRLSAGFTLLELLVVVAIIGLLAAYVGPRYVGQLNKSEVTAARTQIEALARALESYRLDNGSYPSAETGLNALRNRPNNQPRWNGPYLQKEIPLDPWGNAYFYRLSNAARSGRDFELLSFGRDGRAGGSDENADIRF